MSYANIAATNAPPESQQPHPSQAYLEGQGNHNQEGLPDIDSKLIDNKIILTRHINPN